MIQNVIYKEWLPDSPELGVDSMLVALNVVPLDDGSYGPFKPQTLSGAGATLPGLASPSAGLHVTGQTSGFEYLYAASEDYYISQNFGAFSARGATTAGSVLMFAQFDDLVIAARDNALVPQKHTIGSSANFSDLSASTIPSAKAIGVVNRFLVLGNLIDGGISRRGTLRWSSIDDPTDFPTPNSQTAIARQAGEQDLNFAFGEVKAIHGGDQYAIILQRNCVVRMTYVGPPVVFQFDTIDNTKGGYFQRGSIRVGNIVYFVTDIGLCRTDGVSVERIGFGKVDRYFWKAQLFQYDSVVQLAYEPATGLIYIGYQTVSLSRMIGAMIVFNPLTGKYTLVNDAASLILTPVAKFADSGRLIGFNASNISTRFNGTPGTAVIATSDGEFNPGGRSFVSGIKPRIQSSGSAPTVTVRVGSRNNLNDDPTYTAAITANSRTGFADCRQDAQYHRAEITIVGDFENTTGFEFKAVQSGAA